MNITYVEKDKVLFYLCKKLIPEIHQEFYLKKCLDELKIDYQLLEVILYYFKRIGFVGSLNLRHVCPIVYITINTEAFDVFNRGGFTMQENMLQKEVEKLLLEIERLKPTLGDKIEQISTIANNISGIAGSFIGGITGIKSF